MKENSASALIVAKPGPLRDGLHALMMAMPQIGNTYNADDVLSAVNMTAEHCPVLVLMDAGPNGSDARMAVWQIKARCPQAQCVFLANDVQQRQEAEAAGADAALLKGASAEKLVATIVGLLPRQIL